MGLTLKRIAVITSEVNYWTTSFESFFNCYVSDIWQKGARAADTFKALATST